MVSKRGDPGLVLRKGDDAIVLRGPDLREQLLNRFGAAV